MCCRNTESAPEAVPQSREPLYKEDDKVLVWYGRGKNLRTYEAKVSGIWVDLACFVSSGHVHIHS